MRAHFMTYFSIGQAALRLGWFRLGTALIPPWYPLATAQAESRGYQGGLNEARNYF